MIGAAFARPRDPRIERMIRGLEAEHHDRRGAIARAGVVRLLGLEDAAVGGIEPRLADGAHGARGGVEVGEADRAAGPEARAVLHAHPRLGNHAENAFGADEQPVR